MTQFRALPPASRPLTGFERMPAAQVFQADDVYIQPIDIATMPVQSRNETTSGAYTAQLVDAFVVVELTGTSPVVTIPHDVTVPFYDGTILQYQHFATGRPVFVAAFGVIIDWPKAADNTTDCKILRARASPISFRKRATGLWVAEGDVVST